jgi:dTMP kinase
VILGDRKETDMSELLDLITAGAYFPALALGLVLATHALRRARVDAWLARLLDAGDVRWLRPWIPMTLASAAFAIATVTGAMDTAVAAAQSLAALVTAMAGHDAGQAVLALLRAVLGPAAGPPAPPTGMSNPDECEPDEHLVKPQERPAAESIRRRLAVAETVVTALSCATLLVGCIDPLGGHPAAGIEIRTKEPTDGTWGRRLRESASNGRMSAEDELEAFIADRKEHVERVIRPGLEAGKVVIVDRYYFSTAAYQGARGLDPSTILERNEGFAPRPDLLVILDVSPDIGLKRIQARGGGANLFESRDTLKRARELFLEMRGSRGVEVIDGYLDQDKITSLILNALGRGPLFDRMCLKRSHVTQCEPAYCQFRISSQCKWIGLGPYFGRQTTPLQADFLTEARRIAHDKAIAPADKVEAVLQLVPLLEKA